MMGLGVLAVLVVLAIPVAVVVLLVSVSNLKARVGVLERQVRSQGESLDAALMAALPQGPVTHAPPPPDAPGPPEPPAEPAEQALQPVMPEAAAGPWTVPQEPAAAPPEAPVLASPRPAPVPGMSLAARLSDWLKSNWVYAVSALSLALAGVFFVQYGIENGLLTPRMRVMLAVVFGLALIAGGEWLRRRYGDDEGVSTAYLPSTFSGAGIVSIFAGLVAARQLYGLIGPEAALAGLVATALGAIVLGWFHGPFLAAVGLIGATLAPFVVGGESAEPWWFYGYFAVVTLVGLAVDTIRRWAWVSGLALALGFGAGWLLFLASGGPGHFAVYVTALAVLAIAVPARGLWPDQGGTSVLEFQALGARAGRPQFPTLLAAAAVLAASVSLFLMNTQEPGGALAAFLCLAALAGGLALWTTQARALADLVLLPLLAFLGRLVTEALWYGPLYQGVVSGALALRAPETQGPVTTGVLLALGAAMTVAFTLRSLRDRDWPAPWAAGAALAGPVTALILELFWHPSQVNGPYPWALQVTGLATLMVAIAGWFGKQDGENRRRAAYATLSALSLIALALFLVAAEGALTLALAVLLIVAAWLDRRFQLPEMGWFLQAGAAVIGWRLTIDPGLWWAFDAPVPMVALSFLGAIAGMIAARGLLAGKGRRAAEVVLESGAVAAGALFVNVMLTRWIDARLGSGDVASHWSAALNAMPWIVVMLTQLYRLETAGALRWFRIGVAVVAGVIGFAGFLAATLPLNPLIASDLLGQPSLVRGPYVADTLAVAYFLPGLFLIWAPGRMGHLDARVVMVLRAVGTALAVLYVGLEIRRFWRGDDLSVPGVSQYELYSYTVALLIAGAALLWQAIAKGSGTLRRVAMGVIAVTIAKVFLIDASGLTGLTRVFSFLALGLALAALAWLNRWAAGRAERG
jgi:uncharacterized membrane protein